MRYVNLDKVIDEIDRNELLYGDKHGIAREMKEILKVYVNERRKKWK